MGVISCMSTSCDGYCDVCAPSLYLFVIGAAAAINPGGFSCLVGEAPENTVYNTKISSGGGSSTGGYIDPVWPGFANYSSGGSYFISEDYVREVDEYGSYIEYVLYSSSNMSQSNDSGQQSDGPEGENLSTFSYNQKSNATCSNDNPERIFRCEENCSWNSSTSNPGFSEIDSGTGCTGADSCIPTEGDCTSISCSSQSEEYYYVELTGEAQWSNSSTNAKVTLAGRPIDTLSTGRAFSMQSVNIRSNIYRNNQAQNKNGDKCGNGRDDCWYQSPNPIFVPVDNSENTYKAKAYIKVATEFESMKGIKNLSGIIYFYALQAEGEQITCPGENTTFGNPPITSRGFSISNGKNFKDQFCASQEVLLDNDSLQSYIDLPIVAACKVTSIKFE